MFGIGTRILWTLGIALAALLCLWWGISQYGMRQVAEAKVETTVQATVQAVQAVQEAQETRKAEVKVDVQTKKKRRVALDSVRASGIPVEKRIEEVPIPVECAPDPELTRLLNSTIRDANRAIESSRIVPE